MSLILQDDQKVTLAVRPIDAAGNPAAIDGAPAWTVEGANPEILTLAPSADGLSCEALTVGPLGTCQVKVAADARIGPEVKTITGVLDIEVRGGEAVSLAVDASVPVPR